MRKEEKVLVSVIILITVGIFFTVFYFWDGLFQFSSVSSSIASKSSSIRVKILSRHHPRLLSLKNKQTRHVIQIERGKKGLIVNHRKRNTFSTNLVNTPPNTIWEVTVGELKRPYKGDLFFYPKENEIEIINVLDIEDYLIGVLVGEFAAAPLEALKAQAVLSRTLAYQRKSKNKDRNYDVVDLTIDQAYSGYYKGKKYQTAVSATQGQVIRYQKKLITPFWYSTCGEKSLTPQQAWGGPKLGYLREGNRPTYKENLCFQSPHFQWDRQISFQDLKGIIYAKSQYIIEPPFPLFRGNKIWLNENTRWVYPETFRLWVNRERGWNFLKSNDYESTSNGLIHYFRGYGLGHNIGLCQCEAGVLAEQGWLYPQIIKNYYSNIDITGI